MNTEKLKKQVDELIAEQKSDDIKTLLLSYKDLTEHDNALAMTCYLCTIHEQEKAAGQKTIFSKVSNIEELLDRYIRLKFYLMRIEFNVIDDGLSSFYQFLSQNQISSYELIRSMDFSIINQEKVMRIIKGDAVEGNTEKTVDEDITDTGMDKTDKVIRTSGGPEDVRQEICFIICTNNKLYAEECIYYINHLKVPDNIQVDVLTVEDAQSLTAGYNEAMRYSQAKYKVYLHHDTFIINPDFIQDCLHIFRHNPQIGMIGNIGVKTMPASGVMWDADRYGMLYEQHIYETELLANAVRPDLEYLEVEAIDGFLMVTQYDIPWREDLFRKWDFYDCSQSMEFIRRGYKVVVPNMKEPWCVHDCGFINLENYDEEKEKFVQEYLQRQ